MSLTRDQKQDIQALLDKKATLLEKRNHNRLELQKLKNELAAAEDWEVKADLRRSITTGIDLVKLQTEMIRSLSLANIAKTLDVDEGAVIYYQKSSTQNDKPRRPYKKRTNPPMTDGQAAILKECQRRSSPEYKASLKSPL